MINKVISFLKWLLEHIADIKTLIGALLGVLGTLATTSCTFHADNLDMCIRQPNLPQCQVSQPA